MSEEEYYDYLNKEPVVTKTNPDGSYYCPISYVQEQLMQLYRGNTKFELLRENIGTKGSYGVGRLHYKVPYSGEWLFQDGSASIPHDKGMRLDFPALASHIMLSCAKKIGKVFGRDLNRDIEDAPIQLEPEISGTKIKPDMDIMRKYEKAIAEKDESTIRLLTSIYSINLEEDVPVIEVHDDVVANVDEDEANIKKQIRKKNAAKK